ncbi:plant intracellular Ras-group-related LRR protein 8 isoform X2 [Cryptomeria japonica]|uniref:plant intracellular Ras-group-related LRR protein 8 isoform X2 n=1 Tax=Cryptomeria japonica TaxID=3369 RepID=UPI0025ABE2FE|nr:plant intracellular Ras-group-related LRR protein 8 isoform X2 [Cryptomeria japonica]
MDEPSITLHIKFGSDSLQAALPATASVKDLKAHLQSLTNVLPRGQKLIFKGKILEDSVTLKAANLSDGSKIMLMASHGVHQGGGLIKKDSPQTVSKKGLEAKPTRKLNLEKATDITRLQRWKATGVISLFESGLEVVPEDVFAVGPSTRVLDIGDNCLQEVPAEIGNLTNLQKLRLTANNLSDDRIKWQGLVSLKCLTVLALNSNRLCQLPAEIGMLISLKQLNLAQNNLASIPEEVGQLQQLQILNLNNNCLKALPLTIGHCCSLLEVLQLGNNGLRSFPTNVLKGCSQLSTLDLHGNEVTIEDLREVEGWVEFDERRRSKHSKQIEFGVMGSSGFDEGADSQHWNQW